MGRQGRSDGGKGIWKTREWSLRGKKRREVKRCEGKKV